MPTRPKTFSEFVSAYRIAYSVPFLLASLVGITQALLVEPRFGLGALIVWEVFLFAMFVNLSNDYFDHLSGVDRLRFESLEEHKALYGEVLDKTVFWQGNAFDLGYLSRRTGKWVLALLVALLVGSAVPLYLAAGTVVLALGGLGLLLAFFYTAPPLKLGSRGLGEADVLVAFTLICFCSYFVIVPRFESFAIVLSVSVGLTAFLMRVADQMTGYEAHQRAGERDLSIRLGIPRTIRLVEVALVVFYVLCAAAALMNPWCALLFLTAPLAWQARTIYRRQEDAYRLIRAVPAMLKLSSLHSVLAIISVIARSVATSR